MWNLLNVRPTLKFTLKTLQRQGALHNYRLVTETGKRIPERDRPGLPGPTTPAENGDGIPLLDLSYYLHKTTELATDVAIPSRISGCETLTP